jgi:hypothetical protein
MSNYFGTEIDEKISFLQCYSRLQRLPEALIVELLENLHYFKLPYGAVVYKE